MPESLLEIRTILMLSWGGNTVLRYMGAIALFMLLTFALRVGLPFLVRQMSVWTKRSATSIDDAFLALVERTPRWIFTLLALLIALTVLRLPSSGTHMVKASILMMSTIMGIAIARVLIESALVARVPSLRAGDREALPAVLRVTILLILWCVGVLLILSNLGINVISLVAGLGIGGIAVALAVQNILGDLFSSFALFMDKPFREGDFIVTGNHMGVVKQIGLKTTRIQALQGEEIVIPNQELTSARIQNFKRMNERRVVLQFGVTYDTAPDGLRQLPTIIRDIVESMENVRFDRAHFTGFGDSSLNFEAVYYMLTADYATYMNTQQAVNLALLERCNADGISFAFPTRTIHLEKAQ